MIPVTKPYLPSREKLNRYLDGIYERTWLTNNGPLVQELAHRLEQYLGVDNLLLVANGTLALQIAYRALGVAGRVTREKVEVVTTPFSFPATTSSLKWEGVDPTFTDIESNTWCLDPARILEGVTSRTRAIVPVHVFGNACDVEAIDRVARRRQLKVIYDGAHAFGVTYKGESLLNFGDATALSFHATKLFHTGEGGAIVFRRKQDLERARKLINFGINGAESVEGLGINAKMSELQAAMGLCVLDEMDTILRARRRVCEIYRDELAGSVQLQTRDADSTENYSYFPVLFTNEESLMKAKTALFAAGVVSRRYFYPSLDTLEYTSSGPKQLISRDIASRVLCLPVYAGLDDDSVRSICREVKSVIE